MLSAGATLAEFVFLLGAFAEIALLELSLLLDLCSSHLECAGYVGVVLVLSPKIGSCCGSTRHEVAHIVVERHPRNEVTIAAPLDRHPEIEQLLVGRRLGQESLHHRERAINRLS